MQSRPELRNGRERLRLSELHHIFSSQKPKAHNTENCDQTLQQYTPVSSPPTSTPWLIPISKCSLQRSKIEWKLLKNMK
jgi:hypothetical protein